MVDNIVRGIQAKVGCLQRQTTRNSSNAVCQAVADRLVKEVIPAMVEQEVTLLSVNVSEQASIINFCVSGCFVDFEVQNLHSPNLLSGYIDDMQHETVLTWCSARIWQ